MIRPIITAQVEAEKNYQVYKEVEGIDPKGLKVTVKVPDYTVNAQRLEEEIRRANEEISRLEAEIIKNQAVLDEISEL